MALVDLSIAIDAAAVPSEVRAFLREAERRIEHFQRDCPVPAFVPSDYLRAYRLLASLAESPLLRGYLFCEWGSGFGVIACLAAMLEYDAHGIEIDPMLVDCANRLATDFDLPVEFVHASFIPRGGLACLKRADDFGWLTLEERPEEIDARGLATEDFDIVFAYPWPDEERMTGALFQRFASTGAVLVTHHGGEEFRVRRKTGS